MTQRLNYKSPAPGGFAAMLGLEQYVRAGGAYAHSALALDQMAVHAHKG